MPSLELTASTGDHQIDSLLRGLVGIYQTIFPERLSSLYVIGSYSGEKSAAVSKCAGGSVPIGTHKLSSEGIRSVDQVHNYITV
jgi:hypothetical protein